MASTPTPRLQALADAVQARRLQLNLSIIRAAAMAGLSKDTWKRVESADLVRDVTYAKVENTLGWAAGSVQGILDGGRLTLVDTEDEAARPPAEDIGQAITSALVAVADHLTGAEIREVARLAVEELHRRDLV